jgi:signal transduction histidine kinase
VGAAFYALALFVFRIFDPIPLARLKAITQMQDGMLVLDNRKIIVYLNPAAEKIFGQPAAHLKGKEFSNVLGTPTGLDCTGDPRATPTEFSLGSESTIRNFSLRPSSLIDDDGQELGCLIMLHDITEEKHAQVQLIEQQQALATLQERERLARELHDNAGQLLGYINMQAQAIRKWIHDGETDKAEAQLTRLANAAQEAHNDLRESITNLNVGTPDQWSFLSTLQQHLDNYQNTYSINTELVIPGGLDLNTFKPGTSVQLLRVIQEALTNARKHGQANFVRITFEHQDGRVRIIIADDGFGFTPEQVKKDSKDHFGLEFMFDRMEQIGGDMKIVSQPGSGTQVLLEAPIYAE